MNTDKNEKQIPSDQNTLNQKDEAIKKHDLFTDREAANFLRISQITLWRLRKNQEITFRRVSSKIIYLREDLEAYLDRNKRGAIG